MSRITVTVFNTTKKNFQTQNCWKAVVVRGKTGDTVS